MEILDALLIVMKMLGHGALQGLDGPAAMRPEHLPLNVETCGKGLAYCALTADFDAGKAGGQPGLPAGAGGAGERLAGMQSPSVTHVNFFEQPVTGAKLLKWLGG